LHAVTERDAGNSGYNWTATYDGLNRRVSTTSILVTNGVAFTSQPTTINSYFDPQVEFLELGVNYGSTTEWKLYGPDLNGKYGGLNGVGGFDAVSPILNLFEPTVSDFRGNILGVVTNGLSWNPARPTGYGAVPGYQPLPLANGASIAQASAWRGRWSDITGFYNVGLRPYDPISGRWLTYDSVWNEIDASGMTFCGGDPVNRMDADGRLSANNFNQNPTFGLGNANTPSLIDNRPLQFDTSLYTDSTVTPPTLDQYLAIMNPAPQQPVYQPTETIGPIPSYAAVDGLLIGSDINPNSQIGQQVAFNNAVSYITAPAGGIVGELMPADGMIADADAALNSVPSQLTQGVDYEAQRLAALNASKNTVVFQPTPEQVQSAAFQVIVGEPEYTPGGQLVGTIADSTQGGLLEIKGGSSPLNSSYQLRLGTYNSVVNQIPYTIETTRPVNPTFMNYLNRWGVQVTSPTQQ
jgi:RHS repeat-associated protein